LKPYRITTKDDEAIITASSRKEALARYFLQVADGEVGLDRLGNLVMVKDPDYGEQYPFRTVPALWLLGVLDRETAELNLQVLLGVGEKESRDILLTAAKQDAWIVEEVKKLREVKA